MLKAEDVMVTLLDIEAIKEAIKKVLPLKEGDEYQIDNETLFDDNVIISPDCVYYFLCPRFEAGKIQNMWDVPVRTRRKAGAGYTLGLNVEFYFPISAEQMPTYFKGRATLKAYMGSRYDYNPRIIRNMRDFLDAVERGNEVTTK